MKQFDTDTDDMQMSEDYKPTYIHEQHNNNCQQFFGPISNCTFMMPAATASPKQKPKVAKPKAKTVRTPSGKPLTLKYFTHGNNGVLNKQRRRVDIVFRKFTDWKWIDDQTATNEFDALFEGEPRHCNITWKSNSTVLTFFLQKLLKQPYIIKQKRQSPSSMVREQFGLTPNFDTNRLTDDDKFRIEVTFYLLNINNPLPLRKGGADDDYSIADAAFQAVLSGQLRSTKGI